MRYLKSGHSKGFTVVELVTVIVVIGILASVAIIAYGSWRKEVTTSLVQSDLNSALSAMESARNFGSGYPTSIPKTANASNGVTLTYVMGDSKGFCIEAQSTQYSDVKYYVDTTQGKFISTGGCLSGPLYDSKYTAFVYDLGLPNCTSMTIQLPISSPSSASGSTINWGDSSTSTLSSSLQSHTYATEGKYTVLYEGPISSINTSGIASDRAPCLSKVSQWGSGVQPTALRFEDSKNITYVAEPPSSVTSLFHFMWEASAFNQPLIGSWDTSNITDIRGAFGRATSFNQPIDSWDISNVTSLHDVFNGATVFNQPLNSWDTSGVTTLQSCFTNAIAFNQPLNNWDTSSFTGMGWAFSGANSFNGNISNWDTSNVTDMSGMFHHANSFNQNINSWDVSSVTTMSSMFDAGSDNTIVFNQPLNNWNVSAVTNMNHMFQGAINFNQTLASWNTSNVTSMQMMFGGATSFNQNINSWNVGNVTNMFRMFRGASAFNQPLSSWNTASVTNMGQMFQGNFVFDQNISGWNVTSVTDVTNATKRGGGFVENTVTVTNLPTFPL